MERLSKQIVCRGLLSVLGFVYCLQAQTLKQIAVFGECHILRHAVFSHPYIAIAVLDMAEVKAMDAAGLGLLVELRNWAYTKRIQLKLLNLTPRVANLLNRTHLTPRAATGS